MIVDNEEIFEDDNQVLCSMLISHRNMRTLNKMF